MREKILFGAVFVTLLLTLTSMASAIENEAVYSSEDELLERIQERMDERNIKDLTLFKIIKNMNSNDAEDPDGPYRGGLDDSSDYSALFWGCLALFVFMPFSIKLILMPQNNMQLIGGILGATTQGYNIIMNLGEAFDLIEYTEDGN